MKNIKLLSRILKKINELIISNEYKEAYSLGNSFSLVVSMHLFGSLSKVLGRRAIIKL